MVKLMGCFFFAFIFLLATPHRALTHAPSSTSIQQLLSPLSDIHRQFFTVHQLGVKTCCKNLSNHKQFRQIFFVFFPFGGGVQKKVRQTCRLLPAGQMSEASHLLCVGHPRRHLLPLWRAFLLPMEAETSDTKPWNCSFLPPEMHEWFSFVFTCLRSSLICFVHLARSEYSSVFMFFTFELISCRTDMIAPLFPHTRSYKELMWTALVFPVSFLSSS